MSCKLRWTRVVVVVVFFAFGGRGVIASEPPQVQQAREVIKDNGRCIAFFALPTYKYVGTGYNDYRQLSDGYELKFTFETTSFWRTNTTQIAFYIDDAGAFTFCRVLRSTTHYTPFTDAVGKKQLQKLRSFMADYPPVHDSQKLLRLCADADARGLCELYLRLEQTRKNATPSPSSASRGEPLNAAFAQVAPVPRRPLIFERSTGQKRAVVLVHGYRPECDRFLTARAVLQDWQEPDSFMVTILKRDADVYAFYYGQNVPVQEVAAAPELATGVARLKQLGYTDVVLLGYSAGGLVCRYFVEDHPGAGVTKVVQVCTPNSGVFWAKFNGVVTSTQQPYIASLTSANCLQYQQSRTATPLPKNVEFLCVVGDAVAKTDWVVTCKSQWSDDLRDQGVPALRLHASHVGIVEKPESIAAIARTVREPTPRWDGKRVQLERYAILRD